MSLTITEAWIRERVHLTHDNLEDVRSLSLPGTYQEKICNLGNALSSFTHLKQLDLSRNGLQNLQGLQHLGMLEKLNLYYNNISSLQELGRLRHNASLQELDLRLNPVTKNEPDYRLYLVHMLPNLRKLDDRSVRESERKSALLHFDSDQATGMTEHTASPAREGGRGELARSKHVRSLGPRSAVEDDDSDLLDLLARADGDLTKPRPVTGSSAGKPTVDIQDYPRSYSQKTPPRRRPELSGSSYPTDRDRSHTQADSERSNQGQQRSPRSHQRSPQGRQRSPQGHLERSRQGHETERSYQGHETERSYQGYERSRFDAAEEEGTRGRTDSNLRYTDEEDAYTAYSSKINFTPNPKPKTAERGETTSYDMHPSLGGTYEEPPPVQRVTKQMTASSAQGNVESSFLDDLLNLVDRYWNGSKSLHCHSKFQAQAKTLLDQLLTETSASSKAKIDRLQLDVARYAQENVQLRQHQGSVGGAPQSRDRTGADVQRSLDKAQADMDALHDELGRVRAANKQLQTQLEKARRMDTAVSPSGNDADKMKQENDKLRVQLKHFTQLQELATMLQESHKSLVTTNDHLLKELEETKGRHMEEVKQLHWSYNQLKQTMNILPPPGASVRTPQHADRGRHSPQQDSSQGSRTPTTVNGYDLEEEPITSLGYASYSPGKKVKGFSYSNGTL